MFVWLVFVCLLFPDGNPQLCLRGFQVPSEHFIALAWVLILFPSPCFMTATFPLRTENNCQKVSVLFWSVKGGANLCFDATRFTPGLRVTCEASVPEATILFSSNFFFFPVLKLSQTPFVLGGTMKCGTFVTRKDWWGWKPFPMAGSGHH